MRRFSLGTLIQETRDTRAVKRLVDRFKATGSAAPRALKERCEGATLGVLKKREVTPRVGFAVRFLKCLVRGQERAAKLAKVTRVRGERVAPRTTPRCDAYCFLICPRINLLWAMVPSLLNEYPNKRGLVVERFSRADVREDFREGCEGDEGFHFRTVPFATSRPSQCAANAPSSHVIISRAIR